MAETGSLTVVPVDSRTLSTNFNRKTRRPVWTLMCIQFLVCTKPDRECTGLPP